MYKTSSRGYMDQARHIIELRKAPISLVAPRGRQLSCGFDRRHGLVGTSLASDVQPHR